jgi:hypothetical protein
MDNQGADEDEDIDDGDPDGGVNIDTSDSGSEFEE